MAWWKVICTACAAAGAACVCVATGGLAAPAIIGLSAAAGFGGYLTGDAVDKATDQREERLMKDQRYKDKKAERDRQHQENQKNQNLLIELVGKRNGTIARKEGETDESLDNLIAIITNNIKTGEDRLAQLNKELDHLAKQLSSGSLFTSLGLDKLSFMDKVMIAGGVVLVIYLLKK